MERRNFLRATLAIAAAAAVPAALARPRYDAIVAHDTRARDGSKNFPSIAAAIAAAPDHGRRPYRILVTPGTWVEKLVVDKPGIHLIGDPAGGAILRVDAAAGQSDPTGRPWGTWGCATLIVRAVDFRASHLTIANGFDYLGYLETPAWPAIGPNGPQAVALMLADGADRSVLDGCTISGHQDTLFADAGRSLFRRCTISGSVDFVFGAGNALLQRCVLHSRHRPGKERQGYIAAPSTPAAQEFGLTFADCRLEKDAAVPAATVALGRAWRPSREFADGRYGDPSVVGAASFLRCWMDDHIAPAGWDAMSYTARDGQRIALLPAQARLFEAGSRGPGAVTSLARRQLGAAQIQREHDSHRFGDWRPPSY